MQKSTGLVRVVKTNQVEQSLHNEEQLDQVFFALSDPIRRSILDRLGEQALLVSELAAPHSISLQAISRHIQVLVRAGLVQQARTGRISRCSMDVAPIYAAAVWINRYSKYWQDQFTTLVGWLGEIAERRNDEKQLSKPKSKAGKRKTRAQKTLRR